MDCRLSGSTLTARGKHDARDGLQGTYPLLYGLSQDYLEEAKGLPAILPLQLGKDIRRSMATDASLEV